MYDLKNNKMNGTEYKKYTELVSAVRKREKQLWNIQEKIIEKNQGIKRTQHRLYKRYGILSDTICCESIMRNMKEYEEKIYPTPAIYTGKYKNNRALIINPGPSASKILKHKDIMRRTFDVIIGTNAVIVDFGDIMDFHIVMDRVSPKIVKDVGWYSGRYDTDIPTILNWKSAHRFPQDLNIIQAPRSNFNDRPDIRKYRHNDSEGLLIGTLTRAGLRAGSILTQGIHFAGILGCKSVHLIGSEFLFEGNRDHYNDRHYRDNTYFTKPRNKSLIVNIEHKGQIRTTLEYFIDSAEYINKILVPKVCKQGGLEVYDFSSGLLRDDIQADLDTYIGVKGKKAYTIGKN